MPAPTVNHRFDQVYDFFTNPIYKTTLKNQVATPGRTASLMKDKKLTRALKKYFRFYQKSQTWAERPNFRFYEFSALKGKYFCCLVHLLHCVYFFQKKSKINTFWPKKNFYKNILTIGAKLDVRPETAGVVYERYPCYKTFEKNNVTYHVWSPDVVALFLFSRSVTNKNEKALVHKITASDLNAFTNRLEALHAFVSRHQNNYSVPLPQKLVSFPELEPATNIQPTLPATGDHLTPSQIGSLKFSKNVLQNGDTNLEVNPDVWKFWTLKRPKKIIVDANGGTAFVDFTMNEKRIEKKSALEFQILCAILNKCAHNYTYSSNQYGRKIYKYYLDAILFAFGPNSVIQPQNIELVGPFRTPIEKRLLGFLVGSPVTVHQQLKKIRFCLIGRCTNNTTTTGILGKKF